MNVKGILKWTSITVGVAIIGILITVGIVLVREKTPIIEAQTKIEPIQLSGIGQQATEKFSLESGLAIFRMTHSGQSNFAITLLDSNGEIVELLVNEIGSFDGAKAVGIRTKGEYLLDISADGKWSVKIEQPRPSTAPSIPKNFVGKSQQVSELFSMGKGLATFKMTHDGSSNFAILLLDNKGRTVELLVNEIGSFDGSKAVGIAKAGIYLLDISADGNWTIDVGGEKFIPSKETPEKEAKSELEEGCFIATAVYGTPLAPEIDILRDFRDEFLLKNEAGEKFVDFYYQNSPPIANFISEHSTIKEALREVGIKPLVEIVESTRTLWGK